MLKAGLRSGTPRTTHRFGEPNPSGRRAAVRISFSARNWRLALGPWFGRETRFPGNTIVEHRRLCFAMEIPSAQHSAARVGQ
jgi:hypothetical protein